MATQPVVSKALSGSHAGKQILNSKVTIDDSTGQIASTATGVAPLSVSSGLLVSNLNADQVDGLEATSFLRTDLSSTTDGGGRVLTIASGDDLDVNGDLLAGGASSVVLPTSGISGAGTGSGLDADQVDGLDAADFLRSNAADSLTGVITLGAAAGIDASGAPDISGLRTPTSAGAPTGTPNDGAIVVDTTNDNAYIGSGGTWHQLASASAAGVSSWDGQGPLTENQTTGAVTASWDFDYDHTGSDAETGDWDFQGAVSFSDSATTAPAFNESSGAPFTVASTTVVSNLNADQVDGLDASAFLRADTSDTTAGTGVVLTIASGDTLDVNGTLDVDSASTVTWGPTGVITNLNADKLDSLEATDFLRATASDSTAGTGVVLTIATGDDLDVNGDLLAGGATSVVLPTANISGAGTGSGLDADKLDGQEGSHYLDFANMDIASSTWGSILFKGTSGWTYLAPGTDGYVLTAGGANADVSWTTGGGTMDDWVVEDDSAVTKTLQDGNKLIIAGESGVLTTALTGGGPTYTLTVSVDSLGIDTAKIAIDAVTSSKVDWGSGADQVDSTEVPVDTAYTPTNYTRPGTYSGAITDDLLGIDNAIGNIASGLNFKGPIFSTLQLADGAGGSTVRVRAGQIVELSAQPTSAVTYDILYIYDGTTTRSYGPTGSAANVTYTVGSTIDETVENLAAAIEGDGSKITRAVAAVLPDVDTDKVLVLSAAASTGTFESYAANSGGGNWASTQPDYIDAFDGTSDDLAVLPNAQQSTTNFSATLDNDDLNDGDTYVCRTCRSWEYNDATDSQWVTILPPISQSIVGGDGITISTTIPNEISVDLYDYGGLEFNGGKLAINLDGSTLALGLNGISINSGVDMGWSTVAQTFNAGIEVESIDEISTSGNGVTVDGCLIQDGIAAAADKVRTDDHTAAPVGGITAGQVLYVDTSKQLDKANATSSAGGFGSVVGVALNTAAQNNAVELHEGGEVDVLCVGGFTPGSTIDEGYTVYASTTAGSVTVTPATGNGNWVQELGVITDMLSYDGTSDYTIKIEWAPKEAALIV